MRRLLVLACSQRKRLDSDPVPALERYDGPAFRIVRRYLTMTDDRNLDIRVLSAKYGLIHSDLRIDHYDQKMTEDRAREVSAAVMKKMHQLRRSNENYDALFYGGRLYRMTIQPAIDLGQIRATSGSLGQQLSQMRAWLYGDHICHHQPGTSTSRSQVRLRKHIVTITPDEARRQVQALIANPAKQVPALATWFAIEDGQKLPAKWLVSRLTGIPVAEFVTSDALRVLSQLGIQTGRVE